MDDARQRLIITQTTGMRLELTATPGHMVQLRLNDAEGVTLTLDLPTVEANLIRGFLDSADV